MSCYHCGYECRDASIAMEDKIFCCQGCKMVFSILNENDLCTYYDLNEAAGISQRGKSRQEHAFLDDEKTVSRLISFTDGTKSKVQFYIPQIHCSSCLWLLENLHVLNPHILQSRVNFLKKEVQLTFGAEITLRQVVELLDMIGYAPHIILDDLDKGSRPLTDKSLYYKLGLAGFAFGNIMLLSFPEYFGLDADATQKFHSYLSYINIALALPVLFYSGWDYLRSAWQGIKQRHLNIDVPVSLGILALFSRSIYEIITHTGAGYLDSMAGLIFFLLIGKWFQQATYSRISFDRDFKSYFPIACTIITDGKERQVTLDQLDKGDHVLIRHGELIPADAILLKGEAQIDYSFVTGEAALIEKKNGDQLYAGGRQMGAMIEIGITKKVSNSYLTQLWNDHSFDKANEKGAVSQLADRVASLFTWAILTVAAATLLYWLPKDMSIAINAFTAVLIIACPCAVALSIPFTFGNVIRLFARNNIFFKNIHVIETLTKINRVVFDKTGTITTVASSHLSFDGAELSDIEKQLIYSLTRHSTHPLSRQIEQQYQEMTPQDVQDFEEIKGLGVSGVINNVTVRLGSDKFIRTTRPGPPGIVVEINDEIKGVFKQQSQFRTGLNHVINKLNTLATISLVSGDNDEAKLALLPIFKDESQLHFNRQPAEKLAYIKSLQADGLTVAMIGDGLNDAGALNQSEVGIVITENTSNFTPACDIIMDADEFRNIPHVFSFARTAIRIVYASYAIALVYNIIGLSYAVQGLLSPVIAAILMPLSSITIVLFGVGMSTWLWMRRGEK